MNLPIVQQPRTNAKSPIKALPTKIARTARLAETFTAPTKILKKLKKLKNLTSLK